MEVVERVGAEEVPPMVVQPLHQVLMDSGREEVAVEILVEQEMVVVE